MMQMMKGIVRVGSSIQLVMTRMLPLASVKGNLTEPFNLSNCGQVSFLRTTGCVAAVSISRIPRQEGAWVALP